jgi:hypothetical protein
MGEAMGTFAAAERRTGTIRRIVEGRRRWRVSVESWQERDAVRGCLRFQPDDAPAPGPVVWSPAILEGRTHEDLLMLAHDLPEDRLRRVLHSLG